MKKLFKTTLMITSGLLAMTSISANAGSTLSPDDSTCGYVVVESWSNSWASPSGARYVATNQCSNKYKTVLDFTATIAPARGVEVYYGGGEYTPQ